MKAIGAIVAALSLLLGGTAFAEYPEQNVRILVGFPAGTAPDVAARLADDSSRHRPEQGKAAAFENQRCRSTRAPMPVRHARDARIAAGVARVESHLLQERSDPVRYLLRRRQVMDLDPFRHGGADRHPRVEAAVGVLEDDLHPASQPAKQEC